MTFRTLVKSCACATAIAAIFMTNSLTDAQLALGADAANAVADDEEEKEDEEDAFDKFRSETLKTAREGKIDELRKMVSDDLDEQRANWLKSLITAVTLDKAGDANDVATLEKTLDQILGELETDDMTLGRFS